MSKAAPLQKWMLFLSCTRINLGCGGMPAVPYYRAFVIGPDGHVIDRHDLTAADDEAAKKRAQGLSELDQGYGIELWHLDRKIATFQTKHPPRPC
jgi:hypothetical protein